MSAGACRFKILDENPNEQIGGGGCACSPVKHEDAGGPYAVFFATETDSNLSPHNVVCAPCIQAVATEIAATPKRGRKRSG